MLARLLSVRIVRWELKLAYIVGAWVLGWLVVQLFDAIGMPAFVQLPISLLLDAMLFYYATRVFRGAGESLPPARPWWRMTAWRPLSLRIGILFLVLAVMSATSMTLAIFGIPRADTQLVWVAYAPSVVLYGTLAFLYLNSAIRLKRASIVRPEPEPKLTKVPKLD